MPQAANYEIKKPKINIFQVDGLSLKRSNKFLLRVRSKVLLENGFDF